jgi:hypothetical protein
MFSATQTAKSMYQRPCGAVQLFKWREGEGGSLLAASHVCGLLQADSHFPHPTTWTILAACKELDNWCKQVVMVWEQTVVLSGYAHKLIT